MTTFAHIKPGTLHVVDGVVDLAYLSWLDEMDAAVDEWLAQS